ncbi:serine/threonine protein kinase [Tahibacter amnicola]|uniref:Serine/threonine protein kinase n=1 Tax=Tahibacter amnicola TaxID=2976241 RepID=A0ABY6BME0_9GAMM|nr:serine/threonine protein kinase [Tahibacter amnicola]UXI70633.1 serine/threonine protein kinase [Tahibacter amnicola]
MSADDEIRDLLKSDTFGHIERVRRGDQVFVRRDTRSAHWLLRPAARWAARHEARGLERLQGLADVPQLLRWDGEVLERSWMAGAPMQVAAPQDPAWFRQAHRLLKSLRGRGLAHNDLAKEPNWLVTPDNRPAVLDFQICWISRRRGAWFRMLAREDLRHLLKHKRTYCPQALTPVERRLLARRSWLARTWKATGKRVYKYIARRWFGYWDDDGGALRVRRTPPP